MKWLRDLIIRKWFKGWLDKLPANGKKTAISIVVFLVTVGLAYFGHDTSIGSILTLIKDQLVQLQYYDLQNVSLGAAALFAAHKASKWFDTAQRIDESLNPEVPAKKA